MKSGKPKLLRNTVSALIIFGALTLIPNSFADELIQNITEVISEPAADEVIVEEVAPEKELPVVEPSPSPGEIEITDPVVEEQVSDEPEPTPSPSPTPPHALLNQSMRIITPTQVMVDPRARNVFLPKIVYAGQGDLLVCASSSLGSFNTNFVNTALSEEKSSLEIAGANSQFLRISSIGSQAVEILNSGNGLKVSSANRALAGSYLYLRFVALSEVSANPKLCNDGSASNTRTVYLRPLGIDLNITKSGITLK
jgi:hypothetical protein